MKDRILYLDCDGVILDTIDEAYRIMTNLGLDITDKWIVNKFFINVDWNVLIYRAGQIKRSISIIKNIVESNLYKEVIILTKTSGNLEEEKIKRILFGKLLPEVSVITLAFHEHKDNIVDPRGHILVDDSNENCYRWNEAGGIAVLFVRENPNYLKDEIDNLRDIGEAKSIKTLIKTRNF